MRSELKPFVTTATLILTLSLFSHASAEPADTAEGQAPPETEQEVEIDLDALEEEESPAEAHSLVPEEPTLPVRITEVALDRRPWLALVAVMMALPVVMMLIPPRRTNRPRSTREKKEA